MLQARRLVRQLIGIFQYAIGGVICSVGLCLPVHAGSFSVSPVRIFMKPSDRAVAVTLVNEDIIELVLQADVYEWTQQQAGVDELKLSEDLLLSPPIIKLAPGARQVVRLALLRPADLERQLTYRLIVRELPEVGQARERTLQVPISLALSMPVFITPTSAKRVVACGLINQPNGSLAVRCANRGNAYAQVRDAAVLSAGKIISHFEGGVYILPGAEKTWPIPAVDKIGAVGEVKLRIGFDDGQSATYDTGP